MNELMQAIGFTASDLAQNRQLQLTDKQREHLKKLQTRTLLIGVALFVFLAFVATLFLYLGQAQSQIIFTFVGIGMTMLNALALGYMARSWFRMSNDLKPDSTLIAHEGILERVLRPSGQVNNYILRINKHDFSVTKDVFKAFNHETHYTIYATKYSDVLLSAEKK
jgi:hypothetical protein